MNDLEQCRQAIDEIDTQILKLLRERMQVAEDIAQIKLNHNAKVTDRKREQEKLNVLQREGKLLGLSASCVFDVYTAIMAHTVSYEQSYIVASVNQRGLVRDSSVAFLGTIGTYSHLASHRYLNTFRGKIDVLSCQSFAEIIAAVESGKTEYGMLPIENSSSGSINEALDVLQGSKVKVVGEIFYPIDHAILALEKIDLKEITDLYSHPQPVAQCSQFLHELMPKVNIHYMKSSSDSLQAVAKLKNRTHVAIASHHAAAYYNLIPIMDNIANNIHNYTRFICISMTPVSVPPQIEAKTSISFTVAKYTPGSLMQVLNAFSAEGINLVKLSSRPKKDRGQDTWEELFFADVQGNMADPKMQEIIANLKAYTSTLQVLGCYPSAEQRG